MIAQTDDLDICDFPCALTEVDIRVCIHNYQRKHTRRENKHHNNGKNSAYRNINRACHFRRGRRTRYDILLEKIGCKIFDIMLIDI